MCGSRQWGSKLFGCNGEAWDRNDPESLLQEWSYAGYMAGYEEIPEIPNTLNVKDFGAVGDNKTDDTQAFLSAIDSTPKGTALFIPPGVYRITQRLTIGKSMVLRGAGPDKSILYVPKSLTHIYGNSYHWPPSTNNSDYCWAGGFISAMGRRLAKGSTLAGVSEPGVRGSTKLSLTETKKIDVGTWLVITQSHKMAVQTSKDPKFRDTLSTQLYGGLMPPTPALQNGFFDKVMFMFKVTKVDRSSNTIWFDRTLPYDVRAEWGANVYLMEPDLTNIGVESLKIEFPPVMYDGHHNESGWNGIFFQRVAHSWIKDVQVHNADNAVLLKISFFNSVDKVKLTSVFRDPTEDQNIRMLMHGHMGLGVQGGGCNLFTNFNITTYFAHDLVVDNEINTVFTNGTGVDVRCDHHRASPYGNLYSNIDAGDGNRILDWRGPKKHGPHTAAYGTLWNIRSKINTDFWGAINEVGPRINLIGIKHSWKQKLPKTADLVSVGPDHGHELKWNVEPAVEGLELTPANIYDAQLALRRKREGGPSKNTVRRH